MIRFLFLSVIYFPGTFLHEFSHFFFAKILFVPVYGFSLFPRRVGNRFEFGHVRIQRVDIFRRAIIAIAPLLTGVIGVVSIIFLIQRDDVSLPVKWTLGYLFLCVINMMIPSREDFLIARPAIITVLFLIIFLLILFLLRSQGIWH